MPRCLVPFLVLLPFASGSLAFSQTTSGRLSPALVERSRSITVSITPISVVLNASQTEQFTAAVGGAKNRGVTWSLGSPVGTISSNGLYTAPPSIGSKQTVIVKATSVANAGISAQVKITLTPSVVSVAVSPGAIALTASQSQQFKATIAGSSNTAVTWALSAPVGTVSSSGLYTAPSSIPGAQTVTLTATASADPAASAQAVITLNPPQAAVSVSVSPSGETLNDSQTQQFAATVTGSGNTAVTWSVSPSVGTISASGLYTAPSTIGVSQTVTVTATSLGDATKSASAALNLAPVISLSWTASVSPGISGYNVYRGNAPGGPYSKINTSLVAGTAFVDANVQKGNYYYYVVTAVNSSSQESPDSTEVQVLEP